MIRLESDLRFCFDKLSMKFQSILAGHGKEFEVLVKNAIETFDLKNIIEAHVHAKLNEGLEKAFSEIDLSESLKIQIWAEIEKRMKV